MPARDIFHETIKLALIKDGWTITNDPLVLKLRDSDMNIFIDLGAERVIAAEKNHEKIAIESKSFTGVSFMRDFHEAIGQYLDYRVALKDQEPDRQLYLAIPSDIYETFFTRRFIRMVAEEYHLTEIVFDSNLEVILTWIK